MECGQLLDLSSRISYLICACKICDSHCLQILNVPGWVGTLSLDMEHDQLVNMKLLKLC